MSRNICLYYVTLRTENVGYNFSDFIMQGVAVALPVYFATER